MFLGNIEKLAKENANFRKVMHTGKLSQIVLMSIPVGQDIGEEVHPETEQIFLILDGEAEVLLAGESRGVEENDAIFVQAGIVHNIKNTGDEDLKLCTIYSPPQHPDGTVQATKVDANIAEYE